MKTLKRGHPRVIVDSRTGARIKALTARSPVAARIYRTQRAEAEQILSAAPSRYEIRDGRRLLSVSRQVKERVHTLALVYLVENDDRCVERIWRELEAAAQFRDWNPSHFLDTAEMTYAFGIAYDWLFDRWSEGRRKTLREAILRLGLDPGLEVYGSASGWHKRDNNWNQVCNGGLAAGALAIADEAPETAAKILAAGIHSLPLAMRHYGPDGAGTEGATYWDYGTRFNVKMIAALETALGSDFGLAALPGFAESGLYQIYLAGAGGLALDFEDCGLSRLSSPMHFWMARRFRKPEYSWFRLAELEGPQSRAGILDLLWFDDSGKGYDPKRLPLDKYFREAELVCARSAWSDPTALVVAMQAGNSNNFAGHRSLDLGTFILESGGVRWIIDSGVDHETYQTHRNHIRRQDFYRIRAEGHNVLVINPDKGPDQDPRAFARVTSYNSTPELVTATFDLTPAYARHAQRVERKLEVIGRRRVRVTDRVTAAAPAELWWFAHTAAAVELSPDKRAAVLRQQGKTFSARVLSPANAELRVMPAEPLPSSPNPTPQAGNEGRRKLALRLANVRDAEIAVMFEPA
ncbi:MAG: heparinase II/III family protein [Bryobacteraceae bacterium]